MRLLEEKKVVDQLIIELLKTPDKLFPPCIFKGEILTDEHGITLKRRTSCCGGRSKVVDRYKCHHPRIKEGETDCELRCGIKLPLRSVQPQADSISLTVTESTQTAESMQTISD